MKNNIGVIVVISLLLIGIFIYYNQPKEDSNLKVKITYFDKDGNVVGTDRAFKVPSMAVIEENVATRQLLGGIPTTTPPVVTALFEITTTNDGNVPLNITISNIIFSGNFIG